MSGGVDPGVTVLVATGGNMDIVYSLREANWNPQLKYSLRSLVNFKYDRVFTAGHTPDWVVNTTPIPVKQGAEVYRNTTNNLIAACKHPEVSDEFVLMADDIYFLQPVNEIKNHHRGLLGPLVEEEVGGSYRQQRREAYEYLLSLGIKNPLNYDLHIPIVINKHKMLEVLKDLRVGHSHKRSIYGNIVGLEGEFMNDVKIHGKDSRDFDAMTYLSTNADAFALGPAGKYLKQRFKEPSIYEA